LLVVIGIIMALAAMLMPQFLRVRDQGRQQVCASNLRNLAGAMTMYVGDSGGVFPSHRLVEGEPDNPERWWGYDGEARTAEPGTRGFDNPPIDPEGEIYRYAKNPDVFRCPAMRGWQFTAERVGYGYNAFSLGYYDGSEDTSSPPPQHQGSGATPDWFCRVSYVNDSSRTILLADSDRHPSSPTGSYVIWWPDSTIDNGHGPDPRHLRNTVNCVMVDQGVRPYEIEEMFDGTSPRQQLWNPRYEVNYPDPDP